jgi:hypothetical protein
VDLEDPLALLNGRYSVFFFALESCITINSRKGDVNRDLCGLSCTRGVASITWGLEEHSSCMLVKEQLATRAQEDLVSTCGQIKLTQFGLSDSCLSPSGMSSLRAKQFFTFYVEHVSAKFCNSWHLCHSIVEHPEFLKRWSEH